MVPTPHIKAEKDEIAKVVLMPGDPERTKFMAETYLEDAKLINDIRGMFGYTGFYKGKKLSIMTSGMGIPSISIYAYELFNFYDVDAIIRVGSIGSIQPTVKTRDVIIADLALTDSTFMKNFKVPEGYESRGTKELNEKAIEIAKEKGMIIVDDRNGISEIEDSENINVHLGTVLTEEIYYSQADGDMVSDYRKKDVLGFEMEAAALFANAAQAGKKAMSIFTVSNNILTGEEMDPEKRVSSFAEMFEIAFETAISI